jgi:hypothetical protein
VTTMKIVPNVSISIQEFSQISLKCLAIFLGHKSFPVFMGKR